MPEQRDWMRQRLTSRFSGKIKLTIIQTWCKAGPCLKLLFNGQAANGRFA